MEYRMHRITHWLPRQPLFTAYSAIPGPWRRVAQVSAGMFTGAFAVSSRHAVFATDNYTHYIDHILEHEIWSAAGKYILHLGTFSAGVLGALLTPQSLGERDTFQISKQIKKPSATKCFDVRTGQLEDCIVLPNGKRIIGVDIAVLYRELVAAVVVAEMIRGRHR